MRRKHFLILIYHSLYKIYRLINSIEIKTEFVKKIFIFEAILRLFGVVNSNTYNFSVICSQILHKSLVCTVKLIKCPKSLDFP